MSDTDPAPAEEVDLSAPIVFESLKLAEVSVCIEGANYILREANGDVASQYRSACIRCTKMGEGGKIESINNYGSTDLLLVSLCLFRENGHPVPITVIKNWPGRVVTALADRAKKISLLAGDGKKEGRVKNSPPETGDGFE